MFSEAAFLRLAGGDATDFGVRARQVPQKWSHRNGLPASPLVLELPCRY